jgi:HSP20 family molecular chaperone IbpA
VVRFWTSPFEDFERAFDQLFDELLIGPWRTAARRIPSEHAIVMDRGDRYEVQISTAGMDPQQMGIEVTEHRLAVRAQTVGGGTSERSFNFPEPVERESVTVQWSDHVLRIVLPKKSEKRPVKSRKNAKT